MKIKANNALRMAELHRQYREQRDWFYGHGGTVAAYVERYGSANDANHHGEGGEAIFAADWAALERARKALANAGKR